MTRLASRATSHSPAPCAAEIHLVPTSIPEPNTGGATLTARLTQLRRELAETKAQIAAAHGELLALRRHPGNAAPGDGSSRPPSPTTPVKDTSSTT